MASKNASGPRGPFRFRVSDALEVPLRGYLLRLRLEEGLPSMADLQPGRRVRVVSPTDQRREVTIIGHSATGGEATQVRLEATRELDVVISRADAGQGESLIDIGWSATGPVG